MQRGIIAIAGAVAILLFPDVLASLLRILIGLTALGAALVDLASGIRHRRAMDLLTGLVFLGAAVALLFLGDAATRTVVLVLAALILTRAARGLIAAVAAYRNPEGDPFWPATQALLTVLLAIAVILIPESVIHMAVFFVGTVWIVGGLIVLINGLSQDPDTDVPQDIVDVIRRNSMPAVLRRDVTEAIFEGWDTREGTIRFVALMSFATAIATLGIKADSTAVVIGAMLVAPLMAPIMALSASILMGWPKRAARSGWRVALGVMTGIGGSFVVALVSPEFVPFQANSEVLSRVAPTLLDLLIALAAGAAGGYVMTHPRVGNSLPGVAIAVALAPPLAVVGVALEEAAFASAGGAFLLFLTNLVGIVVASGIAFIGSGYSPWTHLERSGEQGRKSLVLVGTALALVILPLAIIGDGIVNAATLQTRASETVEKWLGDEPDFTIGEVRVLGLEVRVLVVGPAEPPDPTALAEELANTLEREVRLELTVVPEQRFSVVARPPGRPAREFDPSSSATSPSAV